MIDFNGSYSLKPYNSWDEIEMFFVDVNIGEYINREIKIPDYANSYLKMPNGQIVNTIMLWEKENIAIVETEEDYSLLSKYGINTFIANDINYEKLKKIFV